MEWRRIAQPTFEPVSVDDLKLHSRIDGASEDAYVGSLITAARLTVEGEAWRALMGTACELVFDAWPQSRSISLWMAPLRSVTSIKYTDDVGVDHTVDPASYIVDTTSTPGRIALKSSASWPAATLQVIGAIRVRYVAGYSDVLAANATQQQISDARALVPINFIHAIKLTAAHLYENREQVVVGAGIVPAQLPLGVHDLIGVDRAFEF